tara:strand:- start:6482 stop:7183 length:702 start_codon:yes stop_codon:yes gene_type:complete
MKPNLQQFKAISSGTEMIVPVNLISDIIHVAAYDSHINPESFAINSLLAFSIYKFDRYRDAQEANTEDITEFYDAILKNKNSIEFLLFSSSVCTITLLIYYQMYIILPVYLSSFLYKNIKTLNFPVKPFYVSSLWTISTCIIPEYTDADILACVSVFMCIFALTNVADISDYEEDMKYNVSSLPTEIGVDNTLNICYLSSLLSTLSFINLDYFSNSVYDYVYILSNIMPYITQ